MAGPKRLPHLDRLLFLFSLLLFLGLAFAGIDRSCLDSADSTYLVSSRAIALGEMPYRDFLLAHPPLAFVVAAPLAWFQDGVIPFRVFSILIVAAIGSGVWLLAYRITANGAIATLAGVLTLFAPLGLFFSKLFINDPLVTLLTILIFLLLFGKSKASLAAAGVLSVLATLTKLTWLPVLIVCVLYVVLFRRKTGWVYLVIALGGSLAAALLIQLVTSGAYFSDIFVSQTSKGYSFANLAGGLKRIWQMDWLLIIPSAVGIWFAVRAILRRRQLSLSLRGKLFLLAGWLVSGLLLLGTLPAEGHDTNLFLLAEPALAILAAWGIIGLAERKTPLIIMAVAVWLAFAVPALIGKDRHFLFRSNALDTAAMVAQVRQLSADDQKVLVPGCYAVEAGRSVTKRFYDQFLWEEKYKRGDQEAQDLFAELKHQIVFREVPVAIFNEEQDARQILGEDLESHYQLSYLSADNPPMQLWSPAAPC